MVTISSASPSSSGGGSNDGITTSKNTSKRAIRSGYSRFLLGTIFFFSFVVTDSTVGAKKISSKTNTLEDLEDFFVSIEQRNEEHKLDGVRNHVLFPAAQGKVVGNSEVRPSMSSDKEEVSLSVLNSSSNDLSPVDEDIVGSGFVDGSVDDTVGSAGPLIDFVPHDGPGVSVERVLKASKQGKKGHKGVKPPVAAPPTVALVSPVVAPSTVAPMIFPVAATPTGESDPCLDVFVGNRTYIPNCNNYINEIEVTCDSEGACRYVHNSIEYDEDGNMVEDDAQCQLIGEFSFAKVKASSQCDLELESIQVSSFGECSFSDQGINYGAPNMLKAEINPEGIMSLIFSANGGVTFFEDIRVATPRDDEGLRLLKESRSIEPECTASLTSYEYIVGPADFSAKCRDTFDCNRIDPGTHCLTEKKRNYPVMYYCYECLRDNDCPSGEYCKITSSSMQCSTVSVDEIPAIREIERGYNIFRADPFFLLSEEAVDLGSTGNHKFYTQQWSTAGIHKITLQKDALYSPIEFQVTAEIQGRTQASTTTMVSSEMFQKEQKSALSIEGSASIKGVDIGAGVGAATAQKMSFEAKSTLQTSASKSYFVLYSFLKSPNSEFVLTAEATTDLTNINNFGWQKFFERYGTHLTIEGLVGAWERRSFRFTEDQRSRLAEMSDSFETALSIGIPLIFGLERKESNTETQVIGETINTMNSDTIAKHKGDMDKLTTQASIIERKLSPICEYVESSGASKNDCYAGLIQYCIAEMRLVDPSATKCELPSDFSFNCFAHTDCSGRSICEKGNCKAVECINTSDCGKWKYCSDNKCLLTGAESDPSKHKCKMHDVKQIWTTCTWAPSCPSGYYKKREENAFCHFGGSRYVCQKDGWYGPPCDKPFSGTCTGGKIGNGCCKAGWCSRWGHCHTDSKLDIYGSKPTVQQCKVMGTGYGRKG